MRRIPPIFAGLLLILVSCAQAQEQQFATLGTCTLTSGQTIRDCRLGYRTFGTLNADKSNAILFPMWFGGRSHEAQLYVGPEKLLDSTRYFIIAVDPLGNGISASPSTSIAQPGTTFPVFTVADMVEVEYRLLTEVLNLTQLHAVIGISMGGMQALEWIVSHPEFSNRAISIVGSPRLSGYDQILWRTIKAAIRSDAAADRMRVGTDAQITAGLMVLALQTPAMISRTVLPENASHVLEQWGKLLAGVDANDRIYQADAMLAHDVVSRLDILSPSSARHVRLNTLVIVAARDQTVDPRPSIEFAKSFQHPPLILDSECGHTLTFCEAQKEIVEAVRAFLD